MRITGEKIFEFRLRALTGRKLTNELHLSFSTKKSVPKEILIKKILR